MSTPTASAVWVRKASQCRMAFDKLQMSDECLPSTCKTNYLWKKQILQAKQQQEQAVQPFNTVALADVSYFIMSPATSSLPPLPLTQRGFCLWIMDLGLN